MLPLRTIFLTASLSLVSSIATAQRAGIVRPSRVAPDSRVLSVTHQLAGLRLNESDSAARAHLGQPLTVGTVGTGSSLVSLSNTKGVTAIVGSDGVGIILVTARNAGDLDGVRVGDSHAAVLERWGPPAAGGASGGLWLGQDIVITVSFDADGHVSRLGIGQG